MPERTECPLCSRDGVATTRPYPRIDATQYDCRAYRRFTLCFEDEMQAKSWPHKSRLSFRTASRSVRGKRPPVLAWDGIRELREDHPLAHVPWIEAKHLCEGEPPDVLVRLDQAIMSLAALHGRPGEKVTLTGDEDCFSFWAEDWKTWTYLLAALRAKGWAQGGNDSEPELTVDGWVKAAEVRRGHGLVEGPAMAFVAMWFDKTMKAIYDEGIAPAIIAAGYEPQRVDMKEHNGRIDDEIIAGIRGARFIVADFTCGEEGARGGVYYEAGYAHGLGRDVIFCIKEDQIDRLHFDTRQFSHIAWKDKADLRRKLEVRILATVGRASVS